MVMLRRFQLDRNLLRVPDTGIALDFRRHKSLRAAIERGIGNSDRPAPRSRDSSRKSQSAPRHHLDSRQERNWKQWGPEVSAAPRTMQRHSAPRRFDGPHQGNSLDSLSRHSSTSRSAGFYGQKAARTQREQSAEHRRDRNQRQDGSTFMERIHRPDNLERREKRDAQIEKASVPEAFPYTTAASEFLYGWSPVLAALRANRRKLYKLYIHDQARSRGPEALNALLTRAKGAGVDVQQVHGDGWYRLMDKASSGRPHNGCILEASPLPRPPLLQLGASSLSSSTFEVTMDRQNREDALVNGTQTEYTYDAAGWRHPLILYVDGVLDEGNLGSIARSAYLLGVDAIVTPLRQSAPWSNITLKASAGAAEAIPVFSVDQASNFLQQSAMKGWRIYASDAIRDEVERPARLASKPSQLPPEGFSSDIVYSLGRSAKHLSNHFPVACHPTILMMGSEDTGLRNSLLNQAHYTVGIRAARNANEVGVDSLNVSVAAALLCHQFMKRPPPSKSPDNILF